MAACDPLFLLSDPRLPPSQRDDYATLAARAGAADAVDTCDLAQAYADRKIPAPPAPLTTDAFRDPQGHFDFHNFRAHYLRVFHDLRFPNHAEDPHPWHMLRDHVCEKHKRFDYPRLSTKAGSTLFAQTVAAMFRAFPYGFYAQESESSPGNPQAAFMLAYDCSSRWASSMFAAFPVTSYGNIVSLAADPIAPRDGFVVAHMDEQMRLRLRYITGDGQEAWFLDIDYSSLLNTDNREHIPMGLYEPDLKIGSEIYPITMATNMSTAQWQQLEIYLSRHTFLPWTDAVAAQIKPLLATHDPQPRRVENMASFFASATGQECEGVLEGIPDGECREAGPMVYVDTHRRAITVGADASVGAVPTAARAEERTLAGGFRVWAGVLQDFPHNSVWGWAATLDYRALFGDELGDHELGFALSGRLALLELVTGVAYERRADGAADRRTNELLFNVGGRLRFGRVNPGNAPHAVPDAYVYVTGRFGLLEKEAGLVAGIGAAWDVFGF